ASFPRATSSMRASVSSPMTRAGVIAASGRVNRPVPHPTSTSRSPSCSAASRSIVSSRARSPDESGRRASYRGAISANEGDILPAGPLHLTVAHFDHGWRADSRDDRDFVAATAAMWGYDFRTARAAEDTPHTEAAARTARYAFLRQTASETTSTAIALGHT